MQNKKKDSTKTDWQLLRLQRGHPGDHSECRSLQWGARLRVVNAELYENPQSIVKSIQWVLTP